ncbi:MAG: hypothetical protein ABI471_10340 [Sphingomonas bacterium]
MTLRRISFAVAILSFALPIFILVDSAPKTDLAGLVFTLLFLLWTSVPTAIPWLLVRRGSGGPSFRWLFSGQLVSFVLATAFYAKILHSGYDSPFIFFVMPATFQWVVLAVTIVAAEMGVSGKL